VSELRFIVKGMSCASCAQSIESAARGFPAITQASVNFATSQATLVLDDDETQKVLPEFMAKIRAQGFEFIERDQFDSALDEEREARSLKFKFSSSLVLSLGLFWFAMGPGMHMENERLNWWIQLALATPIWVGLGLPFLQAVWSFVRTGHATMFTLIGLGTGAAYLYSVFITVFYDFAQKLVIEQMVYFEAVGFIIAFVYLGQYLEHIAKRRARESLDSLLKLQAKEARLLQSDGQEILVPLEKVAVGDRIVIKPGEKVPVDGVIEQGESSFQEAMVTGEPLPIAKGPKAKVIGGTINGEGRVVVRAERVGAESFLAQIVSFVENAQLSKPPIQRYADKIAAYFVPIVVVIALLSFAIWFFFGAEPRWAHALSTLIAVLVIACPCALGLATPTAVVVSTGRAARDGLLIAGGAVIEKASHINAMVFDKTGTLTQGLPVVVRADWSETIEASELAQDKKAVLGLESFSEHPLSTALSHYLSESGVRPLDPDSFEVLPGRGLKGEVSNRQYLIGSERLLTEQGLHDPFQNDALGSRVYVIRDNQLIARFILDDQLKPDAKSMIERLKVRGIKTYLLSGDAQTVAQKIGTELGVDEALGEVLPQDKAKFISSLKEQGLKVAMIGDGINDAPALSLADLSLAMGTGSDVAIENSDVTVVGGEIGKVADFFDLSRQTMSVIRQNLFLSFIYNTVCIPLAAGVFYPWLGWLLPPMMASVAMGASSLSVLGNSLRLKWKLEHSRPRRAS
jgi:heavy metal translocating P-type ATPase